MLSFRLNSILIIIGCICLLTCPKGVCFGSESTHGKAVAIVSSKILPYMEALEAMEKTVAAELNIDTEEVYLESDLHQNTDILVNRYADREDISVFIAVGPQAAYLLWHTLGGHKAKKLYTMVLNPEKVLPDASDLCGVSLNIPVSEQVEIIRRAFTGSHRVGLICNPEQNADVLRMAVEAGEAKGVEIVPLEVTDRKMIPAILLQNWEAIDELWMVPDQTVISESLVSYIIKECLKKGIPAIGFNRYFYEKGAALCFLFEYGDVGRQTGRLVAELLQGRSCTNNAPEYIVWYNIKVLKALGIEYDSEIFSAGRIGPGP